MAEWRDDQEQALPAIPGRETAAALQESVETLGQYILQLGQMIGQMQRRIGELEDQQRRVTVSHAEALRVQAMIRARADACCERYELKSRESVRAIRAAIKRELMRRHGVRDLHDLPAEQLRGAEDEVQKWSGIRLMMELRAKEAGA